MSDFLQPQDLQHARLPCLSLSPRVCSNSCPLSQWCQPTISSSVTPSSSCPQSFPASGSFLMSQLCIGGPKYWTFSFSISPSNEYSGLISFRIDWFNFLTVQRTLKGLLQHHSLKASFLWCSGFFVVRLSSLHDSWKNHSFDYRTFVSKVMSLLFNMLSRFVIALLLRSTSFDSWLLSLSTVILEHLACMLVFEITSLNITITFYKLVSVN